MKKEIGKKISLSKVKVPNVEAHLVCLGKCQRRN
jgi:hypothetical protein